MIDRLLAWWNRPLEDAERRRLAALAALGLVVLAALLVAQQRTGPETRSVTAPAPPPSEAQPPARVAQPAPQSGQQEREDSESSEQHVPNEAEIGAAKRATKRFLAGYLPYTQARKKATAIRSVDPDLRAELARQPARVPLTKQGKARPARVLTLQAEDVERDRASMLALVVEGKRRYTVELRLEREGDQWQVTDVAS